MLRNAHGARHTKMAIGLVKTPFSGSGSGYIYTLQLMENDLWRKTTFDRRQPLTEDNIFDGRRPLTEDDLWRKKNFHVNICISLLCIKLSSCGKSCARAFMTRARVCVQKSSWKKICLTTHILLASHKWVEWTQFEESTCIFSMETPSWWILAI